MVALLSIQDSLGFPRSASASAFGESWYKWAMQEPPVDTLCFRWSPAVQWTRRGIAADDRGNSNSISNDT